jgi:transposase
LEGWTRRRKTAQALSMRARIVLRASEGLTATVIAAETHACIQTVSKWWRRFDERELDGLLNEPRPGQPRKLTDAQIEQVIVRTLESKPPAATQWSTHRLAQATGVNQTASGAPFRWRRIGPKRSRYARNPERFTRACRKHPPQRTAVWINPQSRPSRQKIFDTKLSRHLSQTR